MCHLYRFFFPFCIKPRSSSGGSGGSAPLGGPTNRLCPGCGGGRWLEWWFMCEDGRWLECAWLWEWPWEWEWEWECRWLWELLRVPVPRLWLLVPVPVAGEPERVR